MKIGIGRDIHKLTSGIKLVIGGVNIEHNKGLLGHSDADVLVHSIIDSLLGAIGEYNIGYHFPDTDERYKNVSSLYLLKIVNENFIKTKHLRISNIDAVIIAQNPKLNPFIEDMKKNISEILDIDISQIGIKATTNEGLGDIGLGNAIESIAIVLLEKN